PGPFPLSPAGVQRLHAPCRPASGPGVTQQQPAPDDSRPRRRQARPAAAIQARLPLVVLIPVLEAGAGPPPVAPPWRTIQTASSRLLATTPRIARTIRSRTCSAATPG